LELPSRCIRAFTRPNDLVADNFLGSGSTELAAEQLGRRWIGSDLSLNYLLGSACRFSSGAEFYSVEDPDTVA